MSKQSKHTPGPWEVVESEYGLEVRMAHGVRDAITAVTGPDGWEIHCGPDDEANAELIAAAPDLYEALERLHVAAFDFVASLESWESNAGDLTYDDLHEAQNAVDDALASARGEGKDS